MEYGEVAEGFVRYGRSKENIFGTAKLAVKINQFWRLGSLITPRIG